MLNDDKIKGRTHWYRDYRVHTATLPPNVFLKPETQGQPFDFDKNQGLTLIRVPVLYDVVKDAWRSWKRLLSGRPQCVDRRPTHQHKRLGSVTRLARPLRASALSLLSRRVGNLKPAVSTSLRKSKILYLAAELQPLRDTNMASGLP